MLLCTVSVAGCSLFQIDNTEQVTTRATAEKGRGSCSMPRGVTIGPSCCTGLSQRPSSLREVGSVRCLMAQSTLDCVVMKIMPMLTILRATRGNRCMAMDKDSAS